MRWNASARGTQLKPRVGTAPYRFIPAGAGNTLRSVNGKRRISVYPRWRGEHPESAGSA
ncbi:hypothetical protein SEEH0318_13343 [Salmonella enterica subsp. enterica serovar Heidelberg str. 90-0318]|nr:hypothetical protein SEEH0318_13343 [Salmonella enterica subsp. enterica serovar Heidelberg str. 90-0318]